MSGGRTKSPVNKNSVEIPRVSAWNSDKISFLEVGKQTFKVHKYWIHVMLGLLAWKKIPIVVTHVE